MWSGTFEEAASGLGDDADAWRPFQPTDAWLAIYCHKSIPGRCLTARVFAFATTTDAQQAYAHFQPEGAQAFDAGDEGCWTELGVLFAWGRLVAEVFGPDLTMDSQLQSGLVAGFIINDMPEGAPFDPR